MADHLEEVEAGQSIDYTISDLRRPLATDFAIRRTLESVNRPKQRTDMY
jgi:hypothetical protein